MQTNKVLFAVAGLFVVLLFWPVDTKATLGRVPLANESTKTFSGVREEKAPQSDNDPGYLSIKKSVKNYADQYWKKGYIQCDAKKDRWFALEITSDHRQKPRYFEVINLRIITTVPYRDSDADEDNKVWWAKSVVKGKSYRWCAESAASCGEYESGGFRLSDLSIAFDVLGLLLDHNSPIISRNILQQLDFKIKKGEISAGDPLQMQNLHAPKCSDVRNHPIWKEI